MLKFISQTLLVLLLTSAALAQSPFTIRGNLIKTQTCASQLNLVIEDADAKAGLCPYYVRSFEYIRKDSVLNIQVYREACHNDGFGKSHGELSWCMPLGAQAPGQALTVNVNQVKAGVLSYSESDGTLTFK